MKKNEIACPPGFWCKKKDSLSLREQEDMKKNEIACPPGFWCKKKDNTLVEENQKVKDDPSKQHKDAERQQFVPVQLQLFAHKVKDNKERKDNAEKKVEDFVPVDIQLYALKTIQDQPAEEADESLPDILRQSDRAPNENDSIASQSWRRRTKDQSFGSRRRYRADQLNKEITNADDESLSNILRESKAKDFRLRRRY